VPASPLLVAEVDKELLVAFSLSEASAIADPFAPTEDIVMLARGYAEYAGRAFGRRTRGYAGLAFGRRTRGYAGLAFGRRSRGIRARVRDLCGARPSGSPLRQQRRGPKPLEEPSAGWALELVRSRVARPHTSLASLFAAQFRVGI
jgi:hypothetical protein